MKRLRNALSGTRLGQTLFVGLCGTFVSCVMLKGAFPDLDLASVAATLALMAVLSVAFVGIHISRFGAEPIDELRGYCGELEDLLTKIGKSLNESNRKLLPNAVRALIKANAKIVQAPDLEQKNQIARLQRELADSQTLVKRLQTDATALAAKHQRLSEKLQSNEQELNTARSALQRVQDEQAANKSQSEQTLQHSQMLNRQLSERIEELSAELARVTVELNDSTMLGDQKSLVLDETLELMDNRDQELKAIRPKVAALEACQLKAEESLARLGQQVAEMEASLVAARAEVEATKAQWETELVAAQAEIAEFRVERARLISANDSLGRECNRLTVDMDEVRQAVVDPNKLSSMVEYAFGQIAVFRGQFFVAASLYAAMLQDTAEQSAEESSALKRHELWKVYRYVLREMTPLSDIVRVLRRLPPKMFGAIDARRAELEFRHARRA